MAAKATTSKTSKTAAAKKPIAKKAAKPKQPTGRDLGVPEAYLGPEGKFRPGMDARFKSDVILRALDQPAPKALMQFTQAEAVTLLGRFKQWKPALDRKKALLAAAAAKAKPEEAK